MLIHKGATLSTRAITLVACFQIPSKDNQVHCNTLIIFIRHPSFKATLIPSLKFTYQASMLLISLSSFSWCLPSFKAAYQVSRLLSKTVSRLLTKLQGCLPRQFQGCLPSFKASYTQFQGCLPSFKASYTQFQVCFPSFMAAYPASRLLLKFRAAYQ